jgi:hypothetical protein
MSLARLWREHGKTDEAARMLSGIYGWFTQGLQTRHLVTAKALLQEMNA